MIRDAPDRKGHGMTSRRSVLAGFLGLAGAALLPSSPGHAVAADGEALATETAGALDRAEVEFSQRPQLYYNRQRQLRRQSHARPERPPRVDPRRSRRRWRPAQRPASP